MVKFLGFLFLLVIMVSGYSPAQETASPHKPPKKNVLFLIADDLRPDMGAYGDRLAVTPHLDALARSGVVFRRAYCQKAVCWPSRNSFFSGLKPASLGPKTNARNTFRAEHPDLVSLPQLFKQQGWYTRGFGKILHNGQDDPVSWSEPWYEPEALHYARPENRDKHPIINKAVPENRGNPLFEAAEVEDEAYEDGLTAKAARAAIREAAGREEPFFMMVGFHKPHTPFNAPQKYWDLYDRSRISLAEHPNPPINAPVRYAVHNWNYVRSFKDMPESGPMPEDLAREIKHAYYACISYVDTLVGSLMQELEANDLRQDTIVVFTSDHGYQLGDHSLWSKHTNFELATRVPLIVRAPGLTQRGRSSQALVELVDLYPTLADLAGLELPAHLEGISFLPVLRNPGKKVRSAAFSEFTRAGARGTSLRTEQYRFVEWREIQSGSLVARELYDHAVDPGENRNVAGRPELQSLVENLSMKLSANW